MPTDARAAGAATVATLGTGFTALGVSLQVTDPMLGAAVSVIPAAIGIYMGRKLLEEPSAATGDGVAA